MNLKTTLDEDGEIGGSRIAYYHDAKAAHELLAEREWFRLLAWGYETRHITLSPNRGDYAGTTMGGVVVDGQWTFFADAHPLDDLGLPVRTPELEQALRQALEETT